MSSSLCMRAAVLTLCAVGWATTLPARSAPAYVDRLSARVSVWRQAMPQLRATADDAAARVVAGGNLYVTGPQESFVGEALGRAGGLMLAKGYQADTPLTAQDVVLAASADQRWMDLHDQRWVGLQAKARSAGALLLLFADGETDNSGGGQWLPGGAAAAEEMQGGVRSVSNIVGLWAWTGEFIGACVRHGRMPCVYESIWLPGGRERDTALQGQPFHPATNVTAGAARDLGYRFCGAVRAALERLRKVNRDAVPKAAALLREAGAGGHKVWIDSTSHMFPAEMRSGPTPAWFVPTQAEVQPAREDAVLVLGYQWFPWKQMAELAPEGRACVVTTSRRAPAEFLRDPKHVYVDPCWDIEDACVRIAGYDVPALPLSGVMQGAVYWQLVEEVAKRGK